jgi:glycine cleavage system aminomethyltransferase T
LRFNTTANPGDELFQDGQPVGTVTSVASEATDGVLKGLGYVKAAMAIPGTQLDITGQEKGSAEILAIAQPYGPAKD